MNIKTSLSQAFLIVALVLTATSLSESLSLRGDQSQRQYVLKRRAVLIGGDSSVHSGFLIGCSKDTLTIKSPQSLRQVPLEKIQRIVLLPESRRGGWSTQGALISLYLGNLMAFSANGNPFGFYAAQEEAGTALADLAFAAGGARTISRLGQESEPRKTNPPAGAGG